MPCSIHITYRMSGNSLRPMTMEAYTRPKPELIPGSLAQKITRLILPAAIQWLANQNVPSPALSAVSGNASPQYQADTTRRVCP
jgi:hypothetical protein